MRQMSPVNYQALIASSDLLKCCISFQGGVYLQENEGNITSADAVVTGLVEYVSNKSVLPENARTGNVPHTAAITSYSTSVHTRERQPDKPSHRKSLFKRLGKMGDVISSLEDVLVRLPDEHASKPNQLSNFGYWLFKRFERLGEVGDIKKGISRLEDAVPEHFEPLGEIGDVEKGDPSFHDSLQLAPDGQTNKPIRFDNLGSSLLMRFEHLGEMGDIEKGISSLEDAVRLTPNGLPNKPSLLNTLGHSLLTRFEHLGEMGDLEKGISILEDAVRLTPDGHPDKPSQLNNLGKSLLTHFKCLGEMGDIEMAISCLEDAIRLTPDGYADKPSRLNDLGNSLLKRFEHLGELGDIEKAILTLEDAVLLTLNGHPDKPSRLSNLGNSLLTRFERLGDLEDIEKAISILEYAVRLTPDGHADKPRQLNNLGNSLSRRFSHLGEMGDIEKAISFLEVALRLTPDGHADKPILLNNLGNSLLTRFERLGESGDMEKAISAHEAGVQLTPDGHPDKPGRLNNLGHSLLMRFKHLGVIGDMRKGISGLENAVRLTPDGHPDKPGRLNNLGNSLSTRFSHLGEMGDIEKAISILENAVRLTPDWHADKPSLLNNLSNSLLTRFEHLKDPKDLKRSISAVFDSAKHPTGPPSVRFRSAIEWSQRAHLCHDDSVPSALEAYATAFELLPRLSWLGLSIETRYHELRAARTLACDAAAAAISANNLHQALEWLEQGRSVLWGQILHLRTPVDDLRTTDPKLAEELALISIDLEQGSAHAFQAGGDNNEKAAQKHRRLTKEWVRVIEQVRQLPGFKHFLLPKQYSELRNAACDGPVVVLNSSRYGCDALIIASPLEPLHHVHLDDLTYERAELLQSLLYATLGMQGQTEHTVKEPSFDSDTTFRLILSQLWEWVVKPVCSCFESLQVSD